MLVCVAAAILSYSHDAVSKEASDLFTSYATACQQRFNQSVGVDVFRCVIESIDATEDAVLTSKGLARPRTDHLQSLEASEGLKQVIKENEMLKHLLRNFTCSVDDAGTQPVADLVWEYDVPACGAPPALITPPGEFDESQMQGVEQSKLDAYRTSSFFQQEIADADFSAKAGYLPAGDDLGSETMRLGQAQKHCRTQLPNCQGFTFELRMGGAPPLLPALKAEYTVYFKSRASGAVLAGGWGTFKRLGASAESKNQCAAAAAAAATTTSDISSGGGGGIIGGGNIGGGSTIISDTWGRRSYKVEIIRHEPLVVLVRNFSSAEECRAMIDKHSGGADGMGRAYVGSGTDGAESTQDNYRRSWSSNMQPDLDDPDELLTAFTLRSFALVRSLTGYAVYPEGEMMRINY
jgi:hypothetical protein